MKRLQIEPFARDLTSPGRAKLGIGGLLVRIGKVAGVEYQYDTVGFGKSSCRKRLGIATAAKKGIIAIGWVIDGLSQG